MRVKWIELKNNDPQLLLDLLKANVKPTETGVSFTGFQHKEYLYVLNTLISFPKQIENFDKPRIIERAVHKVIRNKEELTKEKVLAYIKEEFIRLNNQPEKPFYLLTEISGPDFILDREYTIRGVVVKISTTFDNSFVGREDAIRKISASDIISNTPEYYKKVVACVKAKTQKGAFKNGINAIDLLRAIINLETNVAQEIMGRAWLPINQVRLGKAHTVHLENGNIASEEFWFEPHFTPAAPPAFRKKEHNNTILQNVDHILENIQSSPYSECLIDSVLRYVRALDNGDQSTALIQLWGAVESLVARSENNGDLIVSRCVSIFSEKKVTKLILEHVRHIRNVNVHQGSESEVTKNAVFQLQKIYKNIFYFAVLNRQYFKSLNDFHKFLDLDESIEKLNHSIELAKNKVRFLELKRQTGQPVHRVRPVEDWR